ncbi:MAG: hypothetical protein ISP91_10960, partial [Pseudomonadales bacterium]|nr:hypothetical protein [Pseudomonadales bacterium]
MNLFPGSLPPDTREYYFSADKRTMVRLLIVGSALPLFLALFGLVTGFDPLYVVLYNFGIVFLVGLATFVAHRITSYRTLDRFSWVIFLVMIPVFLYLRYTGMMDDQRHDTLAVDLLLDFVIIYIGYTAFPFSPVEKIIGTTLFAISLLTLYSNFIHVIPNGVAGITTAGIAYLVVSLMGFASTSMINRSRAEAFEALQREKSVNKDLSDALDRVKMLSGMLPICSSCKKVRDDQGYYQQIEQYITEHSEAEFTHSICP